MFAINHAAAALLVHRRYPDVSLVPILIAVQAMELVWVLLNYLGLERTTTEAVVKYVGDIHLAYMPFSHSVATMLGVSAIAYGIGVLTRRPRLGAAIALGIASHLLLDLVTHELDIVLAPGLDAAAYGTALYTRLPLAAFVLELGFGVFCWRVFRGGWALLVLIVGFNLANLSLFFAAVPGPEHWLAGRPLLLTTLIMVQIAVTLWAVWWGAARTNRSPVQ